MEYFLSITALNDFVFCPYSIYLHEIYGGNKEETYHSKFQSKGKRLHDFIENNKDAKDLKHAYVYSQKLGIYGKIDEYIPLTKELIEYKSNVAIMFKGYYYQIWSQYLCMTEMGFEIERLSFFDFKINKKTQLDLPTDSEINELTKHINKVKHYDFASEILVNPNKCRRCIYQSLCEKAIL